jgi:general stress protein 26
MKTVTQSNADLAHVCSLIKDTPTAMLTTVDAHGALASRPMVAQEMDANGALWFFTDLLSSKVDQLRAANLSFADAAHGNYVSLSGRGEIDVDRGHIERLWTAFAKPWFPDGPGSPNLALLKFIPEAADYWDAPNNRMVRAFAVIASVVAGKPVGMGDQGSFTGLSEAAPLGAGRS